MDTFYFYLFLFFCFFFWYWALSILLILFLDTSVWTRLATTGYLPQNRKKHSITLFGNDLFVFGGVDLINYQFLNDIHTLNLKSLEWTQQAVKGPIAGVGMCEACVRVSVSVGVRGV
jgi:N-acetylneuraminic acid mutarotase